VDEKIAYDREERGRRTGRKILGDELLTPNAVIVVTP